MELLGQHRAADRLERRARAAAAPTDSSGVVRAAFHLLTVKALERRSAQEFFLSLDSMRAGRLAPMQLAGALAAWGMQVNAVEADALAAALDIDGDGVVSFADFARAVEASRVASETTAQATQDALQVRNVWPPLPEGMTLAGALGVSGMAPQPLGSDALEPSAALAAIRSRVRRKYHTLTDAFLAWDRTHGHGLQKTPLLSIVALRDGLER